MRIVELNTKKETIRICKEFTKWAANQLEIDSVPKIVFSDDKDIVLSKRSFGSTQSNGEIWVYVGDRNTADILRTLCHELVHLKQFQLGLSNHQLTSDKKRKRIEDVANAMAGRLMREYGKSHPEIY